MKPYSEALRAWFYARAFIPNRWEVREADEDKTAAFKAHIAGGCALVWKQEPNFDKEWDWAGTGLPEEPVDGITAQVTCSCDAHWRTVHLFIPGEITLSDVIVQIIEAGEDNA